MKDVSLRLTLNNNGGKQHCLPIWVEVFLKNGALKQKIEVSLYTMYWGFKKIPFTLYTYILAKILQNGLKFIQELTPDFKNHLRNLDNFK